MASVRGLCVALLVGCYDPATLRGSDDAGVIPVGPEAGLGGLTPCLVDKFTEQMLDTQLWMAMGSGATDNGVLDLRIESGSGALAAIQSLGPVSLTGSGARVIIQAVMLDKTAGGLETGLLLTGTGSDKAKLSINNGTITLAPGTHMTGVAYTGVNGSYIGIVRDGGEILGVVGPTPSAVKAVASVPDMLASTSFAVMVFSDSIAGTTTGTHDAQFLNLEADCD